MSRSTPPVAGRSRMWLGWSLVGLLGAAVAVSFAISPDDDAASARKPGVQPRPVTVATAAREALTERGRYPGELDADAADIASFYAGRLLAVHVRVGDLVEKGAAVAALDPVDAREQIAQAHAQATAAVADARRARVEADAAAVELKRLEPLGKDQLISAQELDAQRARAEAAQAAVAAAAARGDEAQARVRLLQRRVIESEVRAPFAGRVAERYVDPGAIVAAGARLVRLVATGPLRVRFEVPEHEVVGLTVGATLRVHTEADASTAVTAKVTGIAGEVSRARRVATMEALLDTPPPGWLPGMFAQVVVDRRTIEDALVVPAVAVLSRLQPSGAVEAGVFIAEGGVARWRPVVVVAREDDRVAIDPGSASVAPGTPVLVAGHVDLSDGSPIAMARPSPPTAEVR